MSYNAYQTTSIRDEDPRATEYRLFAVVTRSLIEASESDASDIKGRIYALDWNRQVWSNLAADCADDNNKLPYALRAGIISLSIFVSKHTSLVMRKGTGFDVLIDINRTVMQGLAPPAKENTTPTSGAGYGALTT
jgi:flagellar protein FlaF